MRKTTVTFLMVISYTALLQAQDPYFSQFYANLVYLNPAYAGFDLGTTVTASYRDQWFGLPDGDIAAGIGYRTFSATADLQLPCFLSLDDWNIGMAFSAFRDDAGAAPMTNQGFGMALSYEQPLWRSNVSRLERMDLRGGMQLSMMQKGLDGSYFIFSNQLDPVAGLLDDPSVLRLRSRMYANLNAGFMLRGLLGGSRNEQETLFTFGMAFSNVNQPFESLDGPSELSRLPMRMTLHAGFTYRITRYRGVTGPIYLAPQFRWDRQAATKLNLQTLGAFVLSKGYYSGLFIQYNFPNEPLLPGASPNWGFLGRNSTVLILNAGLDLRSLFDSGVPWRKREEGVVLGLSYDINLTGLRQQNTLGVLELNLRMNFAPKNSNKSCGDIGRFELYNGKCPVRF